MGEDLLRNTLKVHRAMKDWTQEELARRIGVTRKTVNTIENGIYVPSTALALKMAAAFGVKIEELFELAQAPADSRSGGPDEFPGSAGPGRTE
jgi:putative transcriptional regulator